MEYDIDFNSKVDMTKKSKKFEEAAASINKGKGAMAQVKEMPDGSKRFFNVYGDVHDGWDHILNIFIDTTSLQYVFRALLEGKLKSPEKTDTNEYKGSQITVDLTDEPSMWVLRGTAESLNIEVYQRDERKGFYSPVEEGTWQRSEITVAKLKEDELLPYVMIVEGLRKCFEAEGLVDKLRALNKYSGAGILVSAPDADHIMYRIVQGKERPNLPCEMLFMGTITCRPYMDEMLAGSRISKMSFDERIKAAEDGDFDAMEVLANAYLEGDGAAQDFKKSLYWWEKLAENGNTTAQINTSLHYAKGCGTERDFVKAAEWMEKAVESGGKDIADTAKMYRAADENLLKANAGDASAQAELAKMYSQTGSGLNQINADKDYQVSFKWAEKSADQGDPDGLYVLALCYEHGRGAQQSQKKATEAYEAAAKKGHAPSQWNLACQYLNSYGEDVIKGIMLAYEAADQGYDLAVRGLKESGNTIEKLNEYYADEETIVSLEGTQYEGRADRCEHMRVGDELTYRIAKDKDGQDALEFFLNGGSVGLAYLYSVGKIIALLKLNRVKLKVTVRSCIPKSKRGVRARIAEVTLNMVLTELKPETPEERQARLRREKEEQEAREKAAEEQRRIEEEQKRLAQEEARKVAAEAKARAEEARRIWEEEAALIKKEREYQLEKRITEIERERKNSLLIVQHEKAQKLYDCAKEIEEKTRSLSELEKELASLGFLAFGKKGEIKKSLQAANLRIQELNSSKEMINKEYEEKAAAVNKKADRQAANARPEIEELYPIPDSPEKIEHISLTDLSSTDFSEK